jgi:hypothetical protein
VSGITFDTVGDRIGTKSVEMFGEFGTWTEGHDIVCNLKEAGVLSAGLEFVPLWNLLPGL